MSRQPRIRHKALAAGVLAVIVAAAVALLVQRANRDGGAAQAAPTNQGVAQLWHNVAQCLRTHGHPAFRDPEINGDGDPDFGAQGALVKSAIGDLGQSACRAQVAALPAAAHERPPTTAELHQLVRFARCMRAHGLSDWPDPRTDGRFPLSQRLAASSDRIASLTRVCGPLPGNRRIVTVSPASGPPGEKNPGPTSSP
jgi:hypothetical protein